MSYFDDNEDRLIYGRRRTAAPTPICKEAQANGGKVPLACLFSCTRNCMEEHRAANPSPIKRTRCSADEFEVMPTDQKR